MWKELWHKWFPRIAFPYRFKNILKIPKFIKEIIFIFKNGYPYHAMYANCDWFIQTEKTILEDFLRNHYGYPSEFEKYNTEENPEGGNKEWEKIIRKMITCLEYMDEKGPHYSSTKEILEMSSERSRIFYEEQSKKMEEAKNEFFELYSKYFYNMWD